MAGTDVRDQDKNYIPINISLTSDFHASDDSEWQKECNQFYQQLNGALDEGTLEPESVKSVEGGHRGEFLEMFNTITAGIASIGGLTVLIEIAKLWMEHRKGTEISLKFPDGSEINMSSASKSDIEKVIELYQNKLSNPPA